MMKTKTTPHGGSSHRLAGMAMARFTGTGGGNAGPEEQFQDAPSKDTKDSQGFPKVLEDAEQPKEGELGKSKGKTSDQQAQATGGAEAPPGETLQFQTPLTHD